MFAPPLLVLQIAILLFFAILFLQSGFDKAFDRKGNLAWMEPHSEKSSLKGVVKTLLTVITAFELVTGALSLIATAYAIKTTFDWLEKPKADFVNSASVIYPKSLESSANWALAAAAFALITLLQLFFGQRLAKDYAGAAALVPYFIVAALLVIVSHLHWPLWPRFNTEFGY